MISPLPVHSLTWIIAPLSPLFMTSTTHPSVSPVISTISSFILFVSIPENDSGILNPVAKVDIAPRCTSGNLFSGSFGKGSLKSIMPSPSESVFFATKVFPVLFSTGSKSMYDSKHETQKIITMHADKKLCKKLPPVIPLLGVIGVSYANLK